VAAPAAAQTSITITTPDDWHLHVRDGDNMRSVVPHTAAHFARAIIMPNLVPPVTNVKLVSSWGVGVSHMHEHSTAWHQESEASCTDEQLCRSIRSNSAQPVLPHLGQLHLRLGK
jgi:dihydroorotase